MSETDLLRRLDILARKVSSLETHEQRTPAWINVKDYGARGDGVTDDTAAIQAAWAALPAGGYGVLCFTPNSTFLISDTLDLKEKNLVTIVGNRAKIQTAAGSDFSNKAMVFFNGAYSSMYDLRIESTITVNSPDAGLVLGRTGTNSSGQELFQGVIVNGYFAFAAYYNVGTEVCTFITCYFANYTDGGHSAYISNDDVQSLIGVDSGQLSSYYYGCVFHCFGTTAANNLYLCGAVSDHLFSGCYAYLAPGGYFVYTEDGTGSNGMNNNVFDGIRVEAGDVDHDDTRIWYQNNATGSCGNFSFRSINFAGPASDSPDYWYEIVKTISNCSIEGIYNPYGKGLLLNSTANVTDCTFRGRGENQVTIESGIAFARNRFVWAGEHYPFDATPAGMNLIQYCHNQIANPTVRAFADADATPSVGGGTLFVTANTTGATTITMFDDGFIGQEITVYFGDANTTINFYPGSAYLFGNGGTDFTGTTLDAIKATCTGANQWHCQVIVG